MDELKVTDRRWWARDEAVADVSPEEPRLKPTYLEELETRLAEKDAEIQQLLSRYRGASEEFEQARVRVRKEVLKDVERSRREVLMAFLEVLDNFDRAVTAAADRADDPLVQGVQLVRQQFLSTLEGLGVNRTEPLGQTFDPAAHEAVSTVSASPGVPDGQIVGVIRPGYSLGQDVLRPALVAVARAS